MESSALSAVLPCARPGDVIDVVAPASACRYAELTAGVAVLEEWGYAPRIPPDLFLDRGIVAAPDEVRHAILDRAFSSPDSSVVWCARGGYGSARLLPRLAARPPPRRRKLLVGFSDVTALHVYVNQRWGWPTLHAATIADLGRGRLSARALEELRRVVAGRTARLAYRLRPLNDSARRPDVIEGRLAGGNLTVLQSLLGTRWTARLDGCIVLVEDTGERGYEIDRMLFQLSEAGAFDGIRGLVFGQFTGGREADGRFTGRRVMARFADEASWPVFAGAPVGHGASARPIVLGAPASIDAGPERARLVVTWERAP